MENTGEQFIPDISSDRLKKEHFLRYDFVKKYCADKDVLDVACGTGYGSNEISKVAKSVVGVDLSENAIQYARTHYNSDNLRYVVDDVTNLQNIGENKFDVVLSFETIEHLDKEERVSYFKNLHNLLKTNGVLIISTPNKKITSPFSEKPLNKFHTLEFTKESLVKEVSSHFEVSELCGQRFVNRFLTLRPMWFAIRIVERILGRGLGLYTIIPSPEVSKWDNDNRQPRIIIVMAKHKKDE